MATRTTTWFRIVLCSFIFTCALLPASRGVTAGVSDPADPVPISLEPYVDNVALGDKPDVGDFDGSGNSYPATLFRPRDHFLLDGVPYLLSGIQADNVVALGQSIVLPPGRYCLAHLLVASSYGELVGTITVHYADGTSTTAPLDSPDWNRGPDTPALFSNFRYSRARREYKVAGVYAERIWLDPLRQATSITLPKTNLPAPRRSSLHVFALTLQPALSGPGIKVVGSRSTTRTMSDGSQIVQVTVENVGSDWYTTDAPASVRVTGPGLQTVREGVVSALGPGEVTQVDVAIQSLPGTAPGTPETARISGSLPGARGSTQQVLLTVGTAPYRATTASLQQHTSPDWYTGAKFGIFIHYGLYSIPAWAPVGGVYAEWYWHSMNQKGSPTYLHQLKQYGPRFRYDDFIARFTAQHFDPRAWVELFKQAGARYFVFVTKHHDGFALFRTTRSHRNSVDMGPHRDLVQMLFNAARRYTPEIHPGVYYSLPEWYNPAFGGTRHNKAHFPGGPPRDYVTGRIIPYVGYVPLRTYVRDQQVPQMEELIAQYHPDVFWCDIGGPNDSLKMIASLYNDALVGPVKRQVAVNNRCGVGVHDFTTPEYRSYATSIHAKWEASRGIDPHSYGYNAATPINAYASSDQLIAELVDVVSKNGNLLLDVGPAADGSIPGVMQQRLRDIGAWLRVNGEAIYDTIPWWKTPQESDLRFTVRPNQAFYITALKRPGARVIVHSPVPIRDGDRISLLGWNGSPLDWSRQEGNLVITVPSIALTSSENAWTFKIDWNQPSRRSDARFE